MAEENVEIVRRACEPTLRGELDAALRLAHPDVECVVAREHPDSRTLTGREAPLAFRHDWQEALPDVRFELERTLDAGDRVVGIGTVRGTGDHSGADVRVPLAFVYTLRDGLISRIEEYLSEAMGVAGLEP
jgi:uncharacterized protein